MSWRWNDGRRGDGSVSRLPVKMAIWLFTALVLVGGWAAVLHQVRHERQDAERVAVAQVKNRVIAFEQYVARTFEAADLVSQHLADKFVLGGRLSATGAGSGNPIHIDDPIIDRELLAGVHVVSPGGNLVASTLDLDRRVSVADHPVFRAQARTGSPALQISRPYPSAFVAGKHVHLSRRFTDSSGVTLGFVDVQIRPEQLSNFLKDASFVRTDLISVIGLDGITLARREGDTITAGEDLRGKLVMQMQARDPNGTYLGPSSLDGHVRYFSHRRLRNFPVFVTAGVSRTVAMAPIEGRARIYYSAMTALTIATLLIGFLTFSALNARQRRAEALADANRRLSNAQRVAKVGDWEYDVRSGAVIWSDELCQMYERATSDDNLTIDEFNAYLDEDGKKNVEAALQEALQTGVPQAYEFRAHLPSGAISDRYVIAVPSRGEDGIVTQLHGTDQDVTDERLLRTLQEQVAHLGRVDAMNMMASTLAHELNQPLTAAANYLSGGERLLKSPNPERNGMLLEAIVSAKRQVHGAAQIIRRVRDMIGSQMSISEAASLPRTIDDAVSLLIATGACRRNKVKRELSPDAEFVWADAIQVQQVLVNLLRNACEAAAKTSKPCIKVETQAGPDSFVTVFVADNGPGIERPLEEIFSPFSSEKEEGLGLGLSISRTIVEYHGGRIWVERSDSSGTTLAFTLPKAPADAQAAS